MARYLGDVVDALLEGVQDNLLQHRHGLLAGREGAGEQGLLGACGRAALSRGRGCGAGTRTGTFRNRPWPECSAQRLLLGLEKEVTQSHGAATSPGPQRPQEPVRAGPKPHASRPWALGRCQGSRRREEADSGLSQDPAPATADPAPTTSHWTQVRGHDQHSSGDHHSG